MMQSSTSATSQATSSLSAAATDAFHAHDHEGRNALGYDDLMAALGELCTLSELSAGSQKLIEVIGINSDPRSSASCKTRVYSHQDFMNFYERLSRYQVKAERDSRIKAGAAVTTIPDGAEDSEMLKRVYRNYCKYTVGQGRMAYNDADPQMSSTQFVKMCQDLGLVQPNGDVSVVSVDLIFTKCKPMGGRRFTFTHFLKALSSMASEAKANVFAMAVQLGEQIEVKAANFVPPKAAIPKQQQQPLQPQPPPQRPSPASAEPSEVHSGPSAAQRLTHSDSSLPPLKRMDTQQVVERASNILDRGKGAKASPINSRLRRATESSVADLKTEPSSSSGGNHGSSNLGNISSAQRAESDAAVSIPPAAEPSRMLSPQKSQGLLLSHRGLIVPPGSGGSPSESLTSTGTLLLDPLQERPMYSSEGSRHAPPWAQALMQRIDALESNKVVTSPTRLDGGGGGDDARIRALTGRIAELERTRAAAADGGKAGAAANRPPADGSSAEVALAAITAKALKAQVESLQTAVQEHDREVVARAVAAHSPLQARLQALAGQLRDQQQELEAVQGTVEKLRVAARSKAGRTGGTVALLNGKTAAGPAAGKKARGTWGCPQPHVSRLALRDKADQLQRDIKAGLLEVKRLQQEERAIAARLARQDTASNGKAQRSVPSAELKATAAAAVALTQRARRAARAVQQREGRVAAVRSHAEVGLLRARPMGERLKALDAHHAAQRARLAQVNDKLQTLKKKAGTPKAPASARGGATNSVSNSSSVDNGSAAAASSAASSERAALEAAAASSAQEVEASQQQLTNLKKSLAAVSPDLSRLDGPDGQAPADAARLIESLQSLEDNLPSIDTRIAEVNAAATAMCDDREAGMPSGADVPPASEDASTAKLAKALAAVQALQVLEGAAAQSAGVASVQGPELAGQASQLEQAVQEAVQAEDMGKLEEQIAELQQQLVDGQAGKGGSDAGGGGLGGGGADDMDRGGGGASVLDGESVMGDALEDAVDALEARVQAHVAATNTARSADSWSRLEGVRPHMDALDKLLVGQRDRLAAVHKMLAAARDTSDAASQRGQPAAPQLASHLRDLEGQQQDMVREISNEQEKLLALHRQLGALQTQVKAWRDKAAASDPASAPSSAKLQSLAAAVDELLREYACLQSFADGRGRRIASLRADAQRRLGGSGRVGTARLAALQSGLQDQQAECEALAAAAAAVKAQEDAQAKTTARTLNDSVSSSASMSGGRPGCSAVAPQGGKQAAGRAGPLATLAAEMKADVVRQQERVRALQKQLHATTDDVVRGTVAVEAAALEDALAGQDARLAAAQAEARRASADLLASSTSEQQGQASREVRRHADDVARAMAVVQTLQALDGAAAAASGRAATDVTDHLLAITAQRCDGQVDDDLRQQVARLQAHVDALEAGAYGARISALESSMQSRLRELEGRQARVEDAIGDGVLQASQDKAKAGPPAAAVAAVAGATSASSADLSAVQHKLETQIDQITSDLRQLHVLMAKAHEQDGGARGGGAASTTSGGSADWVPRVEALEGLIAKRQTAVDGQLSQVHGELKTERQRLDANLDVIEANMQELQRHLDQVAQAGQAGRHASAPGTFATTSQLADTENHFLDRLNIHQKDMQVLRETVDQLCKDMQLAGRDVMGLHQQLQQQQQQQQANGGYGGSRSLDGYATVVQLEEAQAVTAQQIQMLHLDFERMVMHAMEGDKKLAHRMDLKDQAMLKIAQQIDMICNSGAVTGAAGRGRDVGGDQGPRSSSVTRLLPRNASDDHVGSLASSHLPQVGPSSAGRSPLSDGSSPPLSSQPSRTLQLLKNGSTNGSGGSGGHLLGGGGEYAHDRGSPTSTRGGGGGSGDVDSAAYESLQQQHDRDRQLMRDTLRGVGGGGGSPGAATPSSGGFRSLSISREMNGHSGGGGRDSAKGFASPNGRGGGTGAGKESPPPLLRGPSGIGGGESQGGRRESEGQGYLSRRMTHSGSRREGDGLATLGSMRAARAAAAAAESGEEESSLAKIFRVIHATSQMPSPPSGRQSGPSRPHRPSE